MRRLGVLSALLENDPESVARRAVFEQALQALGWTVGRDLRIDYRWPGSDPATIQKFAAELAALAPDVILASGNVVIALVGHLDTPQQMCGDPAFPRAYALWAARAKRLKLRPLFGTPCEVLVIIRDLKRHLLGY